MEHIIKRLKSNRRGKVKNVVKIEVEIPRDVLYILRKSKKELGDELKKGMALTLFKNGRLSSGKAAELVGMCLSDFIDLTRIHRIPWVNYTDEELEDEVKEAKKLASKL